MGPDEPVGSVKAAPGNFNWAAAYDPPQPTIGAHGGLRRIGIVPEIATPQGRLSPPYMAPRNTFFHPGTARR
jgi:hypothetical protein